MPSNRNKLPYPGIVSFIDAMATDFMSVTNGNTGSAKRKYKISYADVPSEGSLRKNILADCIPKSIKKVAFDTRRVDQKKTRNPRTNLQYWHRSDPFIDDESQIKINIFSKLAAVLGDIKDEFGTRPDWHESYARILHDAVNRVLRIKQGDNDIDLAQLGYLEQLLDARYRLSMNELANIEKKALKVRILKKDESLLKKGLVFDDSPNNNAPKLNDESIEEKFMKLLAAQANAQVNLIKNNISQQQQQQQIPQQQILQIPQQQFLPVHVGSNKQDEALTSLFGNSGIRRDGENCVERTITITIKDEVKD